MSKYNGMLLFDVADPPIGNWKENLGGRGIYGMWENKKAGLTLMIESNEDSGGEEVWIHDQKGNWDSLFFGDYEESIRYVKEFMKKNANIGSIREVQHRKTKTKKTKRKTTRMRIKPNNLK
jgi:hypothetical protein